MSSRFLKKVAALHGNNIPDSDRLDEYQFPNDESEDSFSFSNKFSILSNELSDTEEEFQTTTPKTEEILIKKPQRNKTKEKKKKCVDKFKDMTEDEMMSTINSMETVAVRTEKIDEPDNVLCLKIRNLNENIELQQLFGPPAESVAMPNVNDRLRQRNQNPILKFTFGKRNPNWPNVSFAKLGLLMTPATEAHRVGNWCIVTCSNDYLRAERALKATTRTGNFQDHLRSYPYHVNTLLQMAAMLVHQEDFSLAADLWKRIFYVYETIAPLGLSLIGASNSTGGSLSKNNFSLDYRHRPNRGIFIALFQWIQYLCQKSCFNTALEYCKVLLSINIDYDPLAIVLLIDDIAIRCDQYDFLIKFYKQFETKKSLKYLPNYALSMAICYFFKSSQTKKKNPDFSTADDLLQQALCSFPTFLMSFAEHCNVKVDEKIAKSSFYSKNDDPHSLEILIQLYSKRSLNFWKNNAVMKWVETNANAVLDKLDVNKKEILEERKRIIGMYSRETPLAIKRHLFLSGFGELAGAGATHLIFDPFPPINSEGGFDHYLENDSELQLNNSWLINLLRSFSPSFGV